MIHWLIEPGHLTDDELIAKYYVSETGAGDPRQDPLAAESERRPLAL